MLPSLIVSSVLMPSGSLVPQSLRAEAMVDPLGTPTATPRLSWKLQPAQKQLRNLRQTGYRIQVGSEPGKNDLWDSGKINSDATYNVRYAGRALPDRAECWWQVQVFDQDGQASDWSDPAHWTVGILAQAEWSAEWIGWDKPVVDSQPSHPLDGASWVWSGNRQEVHLTTTVELRGQPTSAPTTITGDDSFVLLVNGKEVARSPEGNEPWRRPVNVDLASALRAGSNTFEIRATNTHDAGGVIAKMIAEVGGGRVTLTTNDTWTVKQTGEKASVVGSYGSAPWGQVAKALHLPPPRYLRREVRLEKPVRKAMLHSTGLGLTEYRINGQAVSDDLFAPGWTDYTKRVYSRTYDVTPLLREGSNALGVILGDGWYAGYLGYSGTRHHYGSRTRAKAQLYVVYEDGSTQTIRTDGSWKASTGPILESDFLMGELYDARRELTGWDSPDYNDSAWAAVDTGAEVEPDIEPAPYQAVRVYEEVKPVSVKEPKPGVYVFDLGQNLAGWAKLRVQGKAGQRITLRFAEMLNPDGTLYTTNLRGARTIDTYVCKGDGIEVWEPRFTFHGFQYVEVTGIKGMPTAEMITGMAISSATPETGTLETSSDMLNKLVQNAWWTQKMNFIDVPTDCPQRDERLGWTGDAQAYIRTSAMLSDVQPFFTKWLVDLEDAQREDGQFPMVAPLKVAEGDGGPAWADAGVICPWEVYQVYGDRQVLERHYDAMVRFTEFTINRSDNLLPPASFHCFGDWVAMDPNTPNEVIYSAYFAGSTRLVAKTAEILGKTEDAAKYHELADQLAEVFRTAYMLPDGTIKGDTQTCYILAIVFDLVDPVREKQVADKLVKKIEEREWHLSTGFVGTRDIMHALSKIDRNDVAFRLLHNETFPSWGFSIKNGATSIWERWDGWTPEKGFQTPVMNSFAHYAFGAVVGWMFDQMAGIQNAEAGFDTVRIAPQIDPNLTWLDSSFESVHGTIVSRWKIESGVLTMTVVVPPNVKAHVRVPAEGAKTEGLEPSGTEKGATLFEVGSGEYVFTARMSR